MDPVSRWGSLGVFLFFSITGALIVASLLIAHQRGLRNQQICFLWPYVSIKLARMFTILTVSLIILTISDLRKTYLHHISYRIYDIICEDLKHAAERPKRDSTSLSLQGSSKSEHVARKRSKHSQRP
ncbi:hypothetical protein QR680_000036 [Steinernema hermaphroditum]|uniref:Uncharacterized protein n=1 Tax=Steinernema hermaphroditum TaxID=289476 RepID=A0AA39GTT4_9BILA|nr:hypothetical protein QR680_000036 [Steinernema hermaphroditum]